MALKWDHLTDAERQRCLLAVHEAGHATAATLLGGRIAKAVLIDPPGGDMEGKTVHRVVPEGTWPQILYAGGWSEMKWLRGRRPSQADMWSMFADSGQRDYAELSLCGGITAATSSGITVLLERCWSSILAAARMLHKQGEIDHHDVCAALGIPERDNGFELSLIRSGATPGRLKVTKPAA